MVSFLALLSCSEPVLTDVIRGLQVVAVESTPAEPRPELLQSVKLRAWVADGQGQGADVLMWLCTPLPGPDGRLRCAEAYPPGSIKGMPLAAFTLLGRTEPDRPWFEAEAGWPIFAAIAASQYALPREIAGKLFVGVLACAPGTCPIMEQVAINPDSGSEAWQQAMGTLADLSGRAVQPLLQEQGIALPVPDLDEDRAGWLYKLPRAQVSLAVKPVPVYLPDLFSDAADTGVFVVGTNTRPLGPNRAPLLVAPVPPEPDDRVVRLRVSDPDNDPVKVRTFVTAGGVWSDRNGDTGLGILWHEPVDALRPAELFAVAEDGRGGTAVWRWRGEGSCGDVPLRAMLGWPRDPIAPGETIPLRPYNPTASPAPNDQLYVSVPYYVEGPNRPLFRHLQLWVGDELLADTDFAEVRTLGDCRSEPEEPILRIDMPWQQACQRAGKLARIALEVHEPNDYGLPIESAETEVQVVLVAGENSGCGLPP